VSEDVPAQLAGFRPGSQLAGYRLEAQVGAGGMAVVFRARDERLGRLVALKILAPGLAADPAFRRRFIAESRAAAAVDDPHIIPVYEAGEADGVLFIAMRFVSGGDLRGVLDREGPLEPDRAAEFVSPVASALDAAHRAGLVHRDVKPANILVDAGADRPDHVYLSDFGVSKGATSSVGLTGTGVYLGTPDYSAPEQIQGGVVDGRTDQYALACVTYQLLTGTVPFERDQGIAVLLAHLSEPPPPLSAGLPAAADQALARAMAKAPEKRYGSCREFADALRAALGLAGYRSRGPVSAPGQPSGEAGNGKPAVPADLAAVATVDSPPGGEPVPAADVSADVSPGTASVTGPTGPAVAAVPPTTVTSGEGIPAAAAASQPTGPATADVDTRASAPNVFAAGQPVPSGPDADRDRARPGRRPRRLLLAIALACAVLAVAGTVPFLLSSSSSNSSSPRTSGSPSSSSGSNGSSSAALTASAPGITPTTITIGSHQSLTGPAAPGYSEIAPASAAYFAYVNANGGVYGRKIVYKYLDDAYDPTTTASVVRQLVLQDNVYAIFNGLGTPTHLAAVSFLNSEKVPDVFVGSGCDCWNAPSTYPETFGYQLDYISEGKILGQYIAQHFKGQRIGYFYQNDEFGMDGVKGLDDEIPASMVVSKQSYITTNVNIAPQVAALRASDAQVVVAFSIPAFTALLKLNSLKLGFNPTLVVSDVGSDPTTLAGLVQAFAKQGGASINGSALINGIITDGYAPPAGDTSNSWIALFKKVHDQYDANAPFDGNVVYGMEAAYTFVQAMLNAGRNPTRADLVSAIEHGLPQGPMVAPFAYSPTNHLGVTGAYLGTIQNGVVVQQGSVLITNTSATGPVTTYAGSEEQAPASGIPSASS
jgi:branched-chain amino acid transport system substrate-binding protein